MDKNNELNFLEHRIMEDGSVREGDILKVDSFLNHQLDIDLLDQVGATFWHHFRDKGVTRIITIEASGIAIACMTARYFHVPVVFAKKSMSKNIDGSVYTSTVHSYTHGTDSNVILSKSFLNADDRVLIVDDFLANGKATQGLTDICGQAGAEVAGIGIAVEKGFQDGGRYLRDRGYDLLSIAIIDSMSEQDGIRFRSHTID